MTDTAKKLASAASYNTLEEFVVPAAALDQGDWQTIGNCYSGILAEAVTLLVVCFVNLKSVVKEDLNLKSIVSNAGNILGVLQQDVNVNYTLKTALNIKSEVC